MLCENCHLNEAEVKLTVKSKEGTSEKWVCSICAQGENPWQQNETPSHILSFKTILKKHLSSNKYCNIWQRNMVLISMK